MEELEEDLLGSLLEEAAVVEPEELLLLVI
jgi:hypothetical protein